MKHQKFHLEDEVMVELPQKDRKSTVWWVPGEVVAYRGFQSYVSRAGNRVSAYSYQVRLHSGQLVERREGQLQY